MFVSDCTFLTKPYESERLSAYASCSWRQLPDLLYALEPRALPKSLVQPGVPPVQIQDVTEGRVCRLLHSCRRDITHCNAYINTHKQNTGLVQMPFLILLFNQAQQLIQNNNKTGSFEHQVEIHAAQ